MRKSLFFSGKAVNLISKESGLVAGFYHVVEFCQQVSVGKIVVSSQVFTGFIRHFSAQLYRLFISVNKLFFHQIHKTYNNELQIKLINS